MKALSLPGIEEIVTSYLQMKPFLDKE